MRNRIFEIIALLIAVAWPAAGQADNNPTPDLRCQEGGSRNGRARHCEIREQTVPYGGQLTVDGGTNGGVSVKGWTRSDVLVRCKVEAWAENESDARAIASGVRLDLSAGRVAAAGPENQRQDGWAVSFEVFVPTQANLKLTTHNGGIKIADVQGNVEFSAVNGGIHLTRIAGNVNGRTMNGGVHVQLAGDRWTGQGLDVRTTNGGVHLNIPANYSAHLEASTVNGGVRTDYAVSTFETPDTGKRLNVNLGAGGAPLRFATTNGGLIIQKI